MTDAGPMPSTELVAGKYRLTRLLGKGGMGSVWEGVHATLGTRVAVKFIESEYATSAEAVRRFENEARAAARLSSKHVVAVHDHGVTSDGKPYIVMEFLQGEPLDQRLARVGRLSIADTSRIVSQVARALTRAHDGGIIHRDLKPENVFLVYDEEDGSEIAKVVDFGIAKFTEKSGGLSSSTKTGAVLGTPYFMSPEQARGLRSVDHRSDLWSLAVIAFRCITGQLPFDGEAVGDLLVQICTAPVPVPSQIVPGLPPTFDAWLAKALAREPDARFQSAGELADGLAIVAGLPPASRVLNAEHSARIHVSELMPTGVPPVAGVTAAPFTQSTILSPQPKKTPVALIVGALAVASVLVIGVGGAAVYAVAGSRTEASVEPVPGASGGEAVEPEAGAIPSVVPVVPPPVASAATPAPSPSASAEVAAPITTKPASGTKPTGTKTGTTKAGTTKAGSGTKSGGQDIGY